MPIQYDKKAVLEMCADAMKNPALFYTQNLVNYQGICSDAQVPYTEIIAEFLIEHLPKFTNGITPIHRKTSYYTPTHNGEFNPDSNRTEELTAMKMFNACKSGAQYQRVRQFHRLAVAKRTALEFAGEIGDAATPPVFVGEVVHHFGHGHAGADDIGLDLIAIGFGFSHVQMFLLFFRCALW